MKKYTKKEKMMSRIDVKALVMALENRIEALDKNPPDQISQETIVNLLEKAIEDEIKNHFFYIIRKEIVKNIKEKFVKMKDSFVKKTIKEILSSEDFRREIEGKLKKRILNGIEHDC